MISVWMWYSMCRAALFDDSGPSSTSPSGLTRTILLASISSSPQPALFIQTPRARGSRTLACPQIMSPWPAALSARQARTARSAAPAASAGW
jgi:hypothetical protein